MEFIVYDDTVEQSKEIVTVVNYKELGSDIEKRPEDYIFILRPDEYSKYRELNSAIREGRANDLNEEVYAKKYPEVFVIVSTAIKPEFARNYLIADIGNDLVGNNRIVFYIPRKQKPEERMQIVLKRIADFKAETYRHTEN